MSCAVNRVFKLGKLQVSLGGCRLRNFESIKQHQWRSARSDQEFGIECMFGSTMGEYGGLTLLSERWVRKEAAVGEPSLSLHKTTQASSNKKLSQKHLRS